MEFTTNYNLKKPGQDDYVVIGDLNDNADSIDAAMKQLQDNITAGNNIRASGTRLGNVIVGSNISVNNGTISIPNASDTTMGVMRVGDGLTSSNGVVSASYYVDHTVLPDKLSADFLVGETLTIPAVNNTSEIYAAWRDLVKTELGLQTTSTQPFRINVITQKRSNSLTVQTVDVYMSIAPSGTKIASLHRIANFSDGGWMAWRINRYISEYPGNPNGNVYGYRGSLVMDTTTGVLYRQSTGIAAAYNTGWVRTDKDSINDIDTLKNDFDTNGVKKTTENLNIYVNTTTGNDSYDGKTTTTPFKTIKAAIDSLPQIINNNVNINVSAGNYPQSVLIDRGFTGSGNIVITGSTATALTNTHVVTSFSCLNNQIPITIKGFQLNNANGAAVTCRYSKFVIMQYLNIITSSQFDGIFLEVSNAQVTSCQISNRNIAINSRTTSDVISEANTGTGNSIGIGATAANIRKIGTQPSGTNNEFVGSGGQIL